jgi:DNA adenine methylase
MKKITTPLRYPGGKAKALKKILPLIPKEFSEYREPFLGGASVFLSLKQEHPEAKFWINDFNYNVYCFWITLKENPDELIAAIKQVKANCKDGRNLHSKLSHSKASGVFGRGLRFYVLNRITYSGIADCGGYSRQSFEKRFTSSKIEKLKALSNLLQNVEITNEGYESLLKKPGEEVFIFLDPPYWNARKFSLYGKNGDMNRFFDHGKFAENAKMCQHSWLITCDDSDFINGLFAFTPHVNHWEMNYSGMHKSQAVEGKELFIANYNFFKET